MRKVTFVRKNREYVVTVNGRPFIFYSFRDAWEFAFYMRKEVA